MSTAGADLRPASPVAALVRSEGVAERRIITNRPNGLAILNRPERDPATSDKPNDGHPSC
jgi:hypothetical protein